MKSTGMVRKLDNLGRVVLPRELRQTLDIKKDDAMEIFIDGEHIVLQKYTPGCIFCGEIHNMSTFREKPICQTCRDAMKQST